MKQIIIAFLLLFSCAAKSQQWYPMDVGVTNSTSNHWVSDITSFNGKIIIGGHFKTTSTTIANSVAQWDGFHWQPMGLGIWDQSETDFTGYAYKFNTYKSKLVCGGVFNGAGGSFVGDTTHYASCIACWDGSTWHPISPGPLVSGTNGEVIGLGVYDDHLFLGGNFIAVGDSSGISSVHELAEWNDTVFLSPTGLLNGDYSPGLADAYDFANYNNKLIAAGRFNSINGSPYGSYGFIASWDGTVWDSLASGVNAPIFSVVVYNGELYAGGWFTASGDNLTPLNYIAKWDGTQWLPVGEGVNDTVYNLYVDSIQNKLYAGGAFTQTGLGVQARHIAEWSGTNWQEVGGGTNGLVDALYAKDSNLYVGGEFTQVGNSISANNIARWGRSSVGDLQLTKDKKIELYPNPNIGTMTLEYNLISTESAMFTIFDITGREVKQQQLNAQNTSVIIDATQLNPGVYYYIVKQGNTTVKSERLVIVK